MRPVFSPKEYDLIRDLSNVYGTAKQFVLVTPLTKNMPLSPALVTEQGVDPCFFSGRVQHQVHRIPMNSRTCEAEACKMCALTSRRANSPDFSAKLPFLVIQPCLVYLDTRKPHFFLLQNTGCIRTPCHFRGGGASPAHFPQIRLYVTHLHNNPYNKLHSYPLHSLYRVIILFLCFLFFIVW